MSSISAFDIELRKTASQTATSVYDGVAKAWGHWEGSDATLDDSFNVSSLTDSGTGDFAPQFSSNLANVNYSASTNADYDISDASSAASKAKSFAVGSVSIVTASAGSNADLDNTTFKIHGSLA